MSNKLLFVCQWGKDRRKSWSGTHYGIFNALQEYVNLENVDIGMYNGTVYSLVEKAQKAICKILHLKKDFDCAALHHYQKVLRRKYFYNSKGKWTAIQFAECPQQNNILSYYYQDLSASIIKLLYEKDNDMFGYSGFSRVSPKSIYKRTQMQEGAYKSAAGIFCMGKWFQKYLIENGIPANKVHFVGAGINIDANKIDYSLKTGNKILFVGRDFRRKNGPLVLEAFENAKKIRGDIELYIAGANKQKDIDGVHWLGDVPSSKLAHYFNLCDVFCMPSKFEAYGIVFIEALTFGLPCIGRNAYEMPNLIEDNVTGKILMKEDSKELAEDMLLLLENSEIVNTVRARREEFIQQYSWQAVAERMLAIIKEDALKLNN